MLLSVAWSMVAVLHVPMASFLQKLLACCKRCSVAPSHNPALEKLPGKLDLWLTAPVYAYRPMFDQAVQQADVDVKCRLSITDSLGLSTAGMSVR